MTAVATAAATLPLERASLLRAIADKLPLLGGFTDGQAAILREMADEQQRKEEYDAWVRAEVEAALAEPQPGYTTQQVRDYVLGRLREKHGHRQAQAA